MSLYRSYCKVNLSLRVVGRDAVSGYHYIEAFNVRPALYDELYLGDQPGNVPACESPKGILRFDESLVQITGKNLIQKAVEVFEHEYKCTTGLYFDCLKFVPIFAGLGGGSSNAAVALDYCFNKHRPSVALDERVKLAAKVGADVSFCMYTLEPPHSAFVQHFGDIIQRTEFDVDGLYITIAMPRCKGVETVAGYASLKKAAVSFKPAIPPKSLDEVLGVGNSFQESPLPEMAICRDLLAKMRAIAGSSSMKIDVSGSGAACFALFDDKQKSDSFARELCEHTDAPFIGSFALL